MEILFTMLANPEAVEEVALRANGFLNYLRPNALLDRLQSVNPSFSKKMTAARRRGRFILLMRLDRSTEAAVEGKLVFWVGGEDAT